ncbi:MULTISPECIES: hypothetical protein [unclassified Streptomyces]|uniref:hypothetical protein n=1 Tax=unclassified Streptomyces TaxID=2593676 RepID=UPI00037C70CA|nr:MULTISPECIES: hypothetical protein [unclassified Streptomyces]MYX33435.1 hypothetical protein [Streptomyces sp. SID8377]
MSTTTRLTQGSPATTTTLVVTDRHRDVDGQQLLVGRFWSEPGETGTQGVASGPGFVALADDFPPGARLTVTARVDAPTISADTAPGHADTVSPDSVRTASEEPMRRADVRAAIDAAFEITGTGRCDHRCTCGHPHIAHSLTKYCMGCRARCAHTDGHGTGDCPQLLDELHAELPKVVNPEMKPQATTVPELDRVDVEDLVGWLGTVLPQDVQHLAIGAWGNAWDGAEAARAGLAAVRQVLADDDHPLDEDADLGRAVADRIARHRGRAATLAATLDEVLGYFTHDTHPGEKCKQTGHVRVATIDRWRHILASSQDAP